MLTINGTEYAIAPTSDTALIPMMMCLQVQNMKDLNNDAIADLILSRLADPSNHRKLAFSIKSAIPSLPDSLVKYKTYMLSDGREEVEFSFGLSSEQMVEAIAAIMEAREKAMPKPVNTDVEQRKQELLKELELLNAA